ncbi:hypothetical protein [Sinomonas atrocyanea]
MKTLVSVAVIAACLSLTACGGTSSASSAEKTPSSADALKSSCDVMKVLIVGSDKISRSNTSDNTEYIQKMVDIATHERDTGAWELKDVFDSTATSLDVLNKNIKGQGSTDDLDQAINRMKASEDTYNKLCKS